MSGKADLLPEPRPVTEPYWDAVDEGRFELQVCTDCGEWVYYPRDWCPNCSGTSFEWQEASGDGEIRSFTVLYYTPIEEYEDDLPYVLTVIELAEGPQMMANVLDVDPDSVAIGEEVEMVFEQRGDRKLPQFTVAGETA